MSESDLGYDEASLRAGLESWWDEETAESSGPLSVSPAAGTIFDAIPDMDSLSALKGLLTVEEHVPFEVPTKIIRRGGYHSFDDMCSHILPQIEALAREHSAQATTKLTSTASPATTE
jgi:hypothetical protein